MKTLACCWLELSLLLVPLCGLGCGSTTRAHETDSGNTNWLQACATDADCGDLSCYCEVCQTKCEGVLVCSLEPGKACTGAPGAGTAGTPKKLLEHVDPNSYGRDFALQSDGSSVIVGGTDFMLFDLTPTYPTFWLTKLDAMGTPQWEHSEPSPDQSNSPGLSVAVSSSGEIVTVSTQYDGMDTPILRRFAQDGTLVDNSSSAPGFTRLRAAPDGDLFAAGGRFIEDRAGRPFVSAWVGRLGGPDVVWEQAREGSDGSISGISSIDADEVGNLVVAGGLGVSAQDNASTPWLARLDQSGQLLWEHSVVVDELAACTGNLAVLTPAGDSLAAIACPHQAVRAYSSEGSLLWERRFPRPVTALLALSDGGYVVALGDLSAKSEPTDATLQRFDARHELVWQVDQPGCQVFERLAPTEHGVLALAGCQPGYVLTEYADP